MNNYQVLYIIDNSVGEEEKSELVERFSLLVESLGGTVASIEKWGVKKFAYPIDYKKEGYYVLMKFSSDSAAPAEIERQMKNNELIIRQMTTKI